MAFKHALTFFNTSGQEQNPAARINSHLIENELEISIPASYGDSVSIKLFDQFGRALIEKSLMAEKSNRLQSREELEIAGHYFLSINQNGNLQNFHLVKVNEKQDFDFIVQLEVPEIIPALVIAPNPIQNQ
ncbi:hypothetical protein [Persicobacter diffluens]|uniref:hypothetical protein n=1 Tax=Persicobacter diffluens TaxID=981 RepID=UPI0030C66D7C